MEPVIEVRGLVKRYGSFTAVDDVSFNVLPGEVFGILGPNGAGKTTTLEIVEGLQRPTAGSVRVLGYDTASSPAEVKQRIGVQLQASAYFDYLTCEEILELFGSFYRRRLQPRDLLRRMGLLERAQTTVKKLSGGQKQRFTVAASLVNDPDVVILDEPTTGLDPQARRSLWDFIREMHAGGKTIVLTTHYIEEAQALCQRVAIMDQGQIVALDTPRNLLKRLDAPYVMRLSTSRALTAAEAEELGATERPSGSYDGDGYELRVRDSTAALARVLAWAQSHDMTLEELEVIPANLEDVFLDLTGRNLLD